MAIANRRVLAIIPARSGSLRLPGKNFKMLGGKPLIYWSFKAARESRYIDSIIVTTDDPRIISYAKKENISVPFKRPAHLATSRAPTSDVILHAMNYFENRGKGYDIFVLLQPTSPFRSARHIDESLRCFIKQNATAVLSVTKSANKVYWSGSLPQSLCLYHFLRRLKGKAHKEFYTLNGAIYIADWEFFKAKRSWISPKTYAYVMKEKYSIDIDTEEDFLIAAHRIRNLSKL